MALTIRELLSSGNNDAYRRLVHGISDYAIFFLTAEGYIASWNVGAELIKGYRPEEIIGKHFSTFYTPDALAIDWPGEELRRAAAVGRLEDEGWRVRKDGSRFWANVIITALHGDDGTLIGYSKVTRDLTERRADEERLRESERNLRLLVTSVVDYAIYSMDVNGVITGWNLGAERIKGYTTAEAIGKHFSIFYLPEDVARGTPQANLARAAEKGHFEHEGWRVRKDGRRLWARVTITAIRDEDGALLGFSKVTRDLSERRAHEEQLREREENLRLVVEGVKDHAMYLVDPEHRVRTWNGGAQQVLGYDASEVLAQNVALFYSDEERAAGRSTSELASAKASGFLRVEGWRQRRDGTRFWADVATTHLQDDEGNTRGFVQIVRDLTERQRIETLETEGRRIAEFIAMLSHELRNPLAPLRSATAILENLVVDKPEAAWCLELVDRQIGHLTRLVDDLLDVSRVTRGKVRLKRVPLELNTLVRMAVESAKDTVNRYGHTLTMRLANRHLPVAGDAIRLTQVMVNLLNNAAKYTPPNGRLEVSIEDAGQFAILQVADNGIGMTGSLLHRAFEPFVQGDRALDRSDGGLGIGLTLVKTIVELHGGTVTAASPGTGKGTTFTITLPLSDERPHEEAEPVTVTEAGRKVLVVDDNHDAAETLSLLLRLYGHDVQTANDGPQALGVAASMLPDTVIMDIGLPGMDGYEAARRLRALPGLAGVRLIALTGYGQDADRNAALAAGFEYHVTKPADSKELARLIG